MPVAAKFSETFYERFGHDATDELVEYLSTVDRTCRSELERIYDANRARVETRIGQLEAKVDSRISQFEAKVDVRISRLEAKVDARIYQLDAKWDQRTAQIEARFEQRFAELRAELLGWMFLFWVGTMGIMIAVF
jgi:hypothetical protein